MTQRLHEVQVVVKTPNANALLDMEVVQYSVKATWLTRHSLSQIWTNGRLQFQMCYLVVGITNPTISSLEEMA